MFLDFKKWLKNNLWLVLSHFSKNPERWPLWIVKHAVAITKTIGVTLDLAEANLGGCETNYRNVTVIDLYGSFVYIIVDAAGEKLAIDF